MKTLSRAPAEFQANETRITLKVNFSCRILLVNSPPRMLTVGIAI